MASNSRDIALNVYINKKSNGTIKAITDEARTLNNYIRRNLTPGTAEYNAEVKRLRGLNAHLQEHNNAIRKVGGAWDTVKQGLLGVVPSIIAMAGFSAIFEGTKNLISSNAKLSDSFADIQKTTGMTNDEVNSLNQSFKSFNTRTPRNELLSLSVVAGKLGIKGVSDVSKFVKAADQINVALGEDLGDIDTVVRNLGALNNLFNLEKLYGTADAMTKVGSAINSVGAAGTARESALVDFSSRVGGAANSVGLLIDQVIGYGAILDEAMVSSETSSTAISQFWVKMGQDAEKFAGIAGMEVDAFRKLMAEDFNEAFIKVLEGLKSTGGGIEELASSMAGAGVDSSRMIQSLQALANNTDKLREKQKLSAEEFKKGTSLSEEFAVKNENLAAKLERLNKWFTGNFISGGVMKSFEKLISLADEYVQVPLAETLEKERMELNSLVGMLITHNGNQERRNVILAEIQSKYPDFLKNMDTELVTTETLTKALDSYNKEMLRKITLQAYEDQLIALAKEKVALEQERYTAEKEANDAAQEAAKILGVQLSSNMSLMEKMNFLQAESGKLSMGYFDQAKVQNASKYINEMQMLIQKNFWSGATGMDRFNDKIKSIADEMQGILDMRNAFDAANQIEPPAWLSNPLKGLSNIDPNTKFAAAPTGPAELSDEQKKAIQAQIDATKNMLEELELLNISMIEDDFERELTLLHHKKELRKQDVIDSKADAETKKAMLLAIDQEFIISANDLRNKYYDKQKKEGEEYLAERDKQLKEAQDLQYRDAVATAQLKIALSTEGTKERLNAEKELLLLQMRWEINQIKLTEKEKQLLKTETLQQIAKMEANHRKQAAEQEKEAAEQAQEIRDQRMQNALDSMASLAQSMQDIFTLVYNIRKQEIDDERAALEEKNNTLQANAEAEKARAQSSYEDKRISKQEFDNYSRQIDDRFNADRQASEEALDKRAAELEKKAARRKKAIAIAQSIIAGAQAVMQGIAQFGPPPSPAGIAAIAAAVLTTGIQIATITKTKFAKGGPTTPFNTFAGGGHVPGTKIGMIGEAGPEWVAPNWMLRNPATANVIGMLEDMRINKRHYAVGGATASQTQTPVFSPTTTTAPNNAKLEMLMEKLLQRLNVPLEAELHIGNRKIMELGSEIERLKDSQQRGKA